MNYTTIPFGVTLIYVLLTILLFLFVMEFTSKNKRKELVEGLGIRSIFVFLACAFALYVFNCILWGLFQEDAQKAFYPTEVYDANGIFCIFVVHWSLTLILAPVLTFGLLCGIAFFDTGIEWSDYFIDLDVETGEGTEG